MRSYSPCQRSAKRSRTSSGVPASAIASIISSLTAAVMEAKSRSLHAARIASASRSKPLTACVARYVLTVELNAITAAAAARASVRSGATEHVR